jgi:hypothetical protein
MSTATLLATPDPEDRPGALLSAALTGAARGWHVFPVAPNSKIPALHRFDRCPRTGACASGHAGWEQRATTNPDRITAAWSTGRAYNIGLATGPSGLVVIDLDMPKPGETPPDPWNVDGVRDGQDVLAVVAEQAGQPVPGDTLTVATPSGGLHLYFAAPAGVELRNTRGGEGRSLGWKVDTRAHGGYVLAPGSMITNRRYTVLHDQNPAALPDWITDRLHPTPSPVTPPASRHPSKGRRDRYLNAVICAEVQRIADARDGQRNQSLWIASKVLGQLVAGGALSEDEVVNELFAAAWKHIAVGAYSQPPAMASIRSGLEAGRQRPRQVA